MAKPTTIDAYIAAFPTEAAEKLQQIRALIKKTVPDAEERISYSIASFFLNNRMMIYFAGFKQHVSIYPVPTDDPLLQKDCSKYYTSGKGTIQFPLDKPLPVALIRKIARVLRDRNMERAIAKKASKKSA